MVKLNKACLLPLIVVLQLTLMNDSQAQSSFNTLIWSDEFNTAGMPDSSKWSFEKGTGCPLNCGWGNNEQQNYSVSRKENARVENGHLIIEAKKENYEGNHYSSAKLSSKNKFSLQYGRVEVSAKIPGVMGSWPAIWMLGNNIDKAGWPSCGEIDIMEHRGSEPDKIYGTLHYPGRSGGNADGGTIAIKDANAGFHIYTLEWTAASIVIKADGQICHSVANSKAIPFNHDFYFILNLAVGGNFGGEVDKNFTNAAMEVDYIRVYK